MDVQEKVFSYIREHHMLQPGDSVVAGISGGADSVCLLFVLLEWAKQSPMKLSVVHVNHGIRREAPEDAEYVERLCREQDLPFFLVEEDVPGYALRERCSEEEAGRRIRYDAFYRAAQEQGAQKIAVAHNLNDRSETMLFHLFRGSGIKGLGSILPVRGAIIRPLLGLERREIEDYLLERAVSWQEDATNARDTYTRNRIRHHIMPYVEREIVSGAARHMAQTAELLAETEEYLDGQTREALRECAEEIYGEAGSEESVPGGYRIAVGTFCRYHRVMQKRMLFTLVQSLTVSRKDISAIHIQQLQTLFTLDGNRRICLPFGIAGRRSYEWVYLEARPPQEPQEKKEWEIQVPPVGQCMEWEDEEGFTLAFETFFYELGQEVPRNEYTKWFDCDKIKKPLMLRTRRSGDYLTIADGTGGYRHKPLKDYMIDRKIPREHREKLFFLAEGQHVLWLPRYRISEYYKISGNTKRILQVQLIRRDCGSSETEEKNGRTY